MKFLAIVATWIGCLVIGLIATARFDMVPGPAGEASEYWPSDTSIGRARTGVTVVMTVHPRCPCTHASLIELGEALGQTSERPAVRILCFSPSDADASWTDSPIARLARNIPGALVTYDVRGAEAARFGAETSGQVMVYDASGRRVYSGGVTGARGHTGRNAGRAALVAHFNGSYASGHEPVYGCALFAREAVCGDATECAR